MVGWTDGGGVYAGVVFAGLLAAVGCAASRRLAAAREPALGVVRPLRAVPLPERRDAA